VARVELSATAVEDLHELIATHELPGDTAARVAGSLRALERFPEMGAALGGRWSGMRFLLGPWRWMLLVYVVLDGGARVVVVTIQDARAASGPTAERSAHVRRRERHGRDARGVANASACGRADRLEAPARRSRLPAETR
jgi:hypothetical protein